VKKIIIEGLYQLFHGQKSLLEKDAICLRSWRSVAMPTLVNLEHYLYFTMSMPVLRTKYVEAVPAFSFLGRGPRIATARKLLISTYGMLMPRGHWFGEMTCYLSAILQLFRLQLNREGLSGTLLPENAIAGMLKGPSKEYTYRNYDWC